MDHKLTLEKLLEQLLADGLISDQQRRQLLQSPARHSDDQHPLLRISEQGWNSATRPSYPLTLERLTRWLADKAGLPYVRIDPLKIDVEAATKSVSQAYAQRFGFLPLEVTPGELTVATAEPFVREWEPELSRVLRRRIKRVAANPRDIARYQIEFYGVSRSIYGAAHRAASMVPGQSFEQMVELGRVGELDANDQHIVHLVDWLLQYAFEQRASDIHLEPRREKANIRFRIDGKLHLVHELPGPVMNAICSRLKALGRMDVTDKRRPQDGRIKSKTPAGQEVEMRLSSMPTTFGEKLVLRIFNPDLLTRSFADLGFGAQDIACWKSMTDSPHGMILVTGPTGSGKTTTLYSALKQLAKPEFNICTIEDPIEMVEPSFNQMQVQPAIDLTFAAGVRTLMRQDPDIIMVGEVRDLATADVAIQAALTGHLVLTTLHTNDAASAVTRLLDLGVQPFLIGATLLGVVAQRLVRTLCPHCKQPGEVDPLAWATLVAGLEIPPPEGAFQPVGCDECRQTGYLGRAGIYEILEMGREMRRLIRPGMDTSELRDYALRHGMRPLRDSGATLIAAGRTTLEEVLSVVSTRADES